MKAIVVGEVERLLFRNNIGKRAQYYGICFLNGIRVLGDESTVAVKLVKVYLAFFKACIKTVRSLIELTLFDTVESASSKPGCSKLMVKIRL